MRVTELRYKWRFVRNAGNDAVAVLPTMKGTAEDELGLATDFDEA